jgi:3-hydroxybutyryl-CoA dehydratase
MSIIRPLAVARQERDERKVGRLHTTPSSDPLYLEDIQIGDRWSSDIREITSLDVEEFATLTGDHDPLHRSDSNHSPFGEPVAHGLLGLSVLAGLSTRSPNVSTLALVGISEWQFESPIFFGDHVHVVTEVEAIHQHGRRAGRVTWRRQLLNQHGKVVQRGRFVTLVAARNRGRRLSPQEDGSAKRNLPPR